MDITLYTLQVASTELVDMCTVVICLLECVDRVSNGWNSHLNVGAQAQ